MECIEKDFKRFDEFSNNFFDSLFFLDVGDGSLEMFSIWEKWIVKRVIVRFVEFFGVFFYIF